VARGDLPVLISPMLPNLKCELDRLHAKASIADPTGKAKSAAIQLGKVRKCAGVSDRLGFCTLRLDHLILERSLDTAGRSLYHNCVLRAVRPKGSLTCIFG
jgi:hypothetical protein